MKNNWNSIQVAHRYRFEQRVRSNNEGVELTDGWDIFYRVRYRLKFGIPLNQKSGAGAISLSILDEIMLNLGNDIVRNTFNQNRIYVGAAIKLQDDLTLQTGVLNLFQQLSSGDDFRSNFIVRTTISYAL